jgi:hypothetical protein
MSEAAVLNAEEQRSGGDSMAAVQATAAARPAGRNWRAIVFPILAGLFGLAGFVVLDGIREGIAPWHLAVDYDPAPEVHRFQYAQHGATVGILFSGSLLAMLWRPATKPLLLQFYVLGFLTLTVTYTALTLTPVAIIFATVLTLLAITYPNRAELFSFRGSESMSRPLLGMAAVGAATLLPYAAVNLWREIDGVDAAAYGDSMRWAGSAVLAFGLILAGLLAATRRPGFRELGIILGIDFLFLGAAALKVPDHDGSWGVAGGVLSLIWGAAWIAMTIHESRR